MAGPWPPVLIWINGPFGGGKTQTAFELHRRLPGSVVCDPEHVGFGLHRTLPRRLRGDFQDLPAWRAGVLEVLDLTLRTGGETVIVPMTLVEPAYFTEVVGGLRRRGHDVRHFALLARRETVLRRLRERGLGRLVRALSGDASALSDESFAVRNLDRCLDALVDEQFADQIHTDDIPVAAVAALIADRCGLSLAGAADGALRGRVRRAWIGVRHLRL